MRRFLPILFVFFVLFGVVPSKRAAADYGDACYWNPWGYAPCADENTVAAIQTASNRYSVDYDWLMTIAACESDFVEDLVGPYGEIGTFQFLPSTFYWIKPYGNIWDVWDQADAAAWAFANGWSWLWTCSRLI